MKGRKAMTIAGFTVAAMMLATAPGIAQNQSRDERQRLAQSSGTADRSGSNRTSFTEYMQAHRDAHAEKSEELRRRYEFRDKYLGNGE